jgi:hypothetical protein
MSWILRIKSFLGSTKSGETGRLNREESTDRPTASGHRFGPDLSCSECGIGWDEHQRNPLPCKTDVTSDAFNRRPSGATNTKSTQSTQAPPPKELSPEQGRDPAPAKKDGDETPVDSRTASGTADSSRDG